MGRLLDLTERSFVDAQDVKDLIADCGVKQPLAKVCFCMELMNSVRSLSSRLFADEEDRIRFMDAISQDLAATISMIEGVVDARVHVVLPENDPFAKNALPSSAAVAIRARWDADLSDAIPQVKGLVKNAIEGLAFEKITVTVFQDEPAKK